MSEQIFYEDIEVGDEIDQIEFGPLTNENLARWAAGSGDFNPIHYDQEYSRIQGLPNVIAPGPFKSSLVCRMLLSWIGKKGRIAKLHSRYKSMDIPGDTLICEGKVTKKFIRDNMRSLECEFSVSNQKKEISVSGYAVLVIPSRECP